MLAANLSTNTDLDALQEQALQLILAVEQEALGLPGSEQAEFVASRTSLLMRHLRTIQDYKLQSDQLER